jgi:hypothetical protein
MSGTGRQLAGPPSLVAADFFFPSSGFYSVVVVELNYCISKRKGKNGGQEERTEGKKRRKGGKEK